MPSPLAVSTVVLVLVLLALVAAGGVVARAVLRRRSARRPTPEQRWRHFLAAVEPTLAASPRVHLVGAVPLEGDPTTAARPLAVGIVVAGDDEAAIARTAASVGAQTVAPTTVLAGTAADVMREAQEAGDAPVVLVDAGDELAPLALERLGQAWTLAPEVALLTADEDVLDDAGGRQHPRLRQGPSPDGQLARAAADGLVALDPARLPGAASAAIRQGTGTRRLVATLAAGPDAGGHGHVPLLLLHRRAPVGRAWDAPWRPQDAEAAATAFGEAASAEVAPSGLVRVRYPLPAALPSVEVVVLFRDKPELTERCARSVLDESTYAGPLRLQLVDNGSEDPGVLPMLERLSADPRVVAVRDDQPFNYAALNNAAVRRSDADVVLLLNNDTAVRSPDWIEGMLEHALRPSVGAVGVLLTYPDGTVQHAGAALGLHGFAGHPWQGRRPDEDTPLGAPGDGVRNWLAVTAACLMVRRDAWDAVGGFDEGFVVAGNDVDLCLRLTASGRRSVCVPHVALLHDESKSRGTYVDPGDYEASIRSYGAFRTVGDPYFHPALALDDSSVVLRG
ncbi:glycosyltransferase [Patulibacter brassicae]|uniref:Glycosyltransferase n=1 Tax=Patulibacter brassicae TaxID=1705717 RepID=A0ABU4VLA5_9ACTN|nr:glycosyltransferase [Patulibacter brassicae]MDX8151653.1 glycosyltransferase [Patulibacter brassicae]